MKLFSKAGCLLLAMLILALAGCAKPNATVPAEPVFDGSLDWKLHGVWVMEDGTLQEGQESVEFSLKGTLPTEYELYSNVDVELDFRFPGSMGYINPGMQTYVAGASLANKHSNQHIYHSVGWLMLADGRDSTSMSFTICPEAGFAVVHLKDQYLVSSIDPNANAGEIFAFYKAYVH